MKFVAKTFAGLEELLVNELRPIGAKNIRIKRRAVTFEGDNEILYKANMHCRLALSILVEIDTFYAKSADDLYNKAMKVHWSDYMLVGDTFAVFATTYSKVFDHTMFVSLKVKDAIADFFRDIYGKRPDVDSKNPKVKFEVHISDNKVSLLLNSSGDALFKRGYRLQTGKAPMNECLAAGIIKMTGYKGERPFIDFTCGSGTLCIEAGMIAKRIAPGSLGRTFGFQKWFNYDKELFEKVLAEAKSKEKDNIVKIYGYDIDRKMVSFSRDNKERIPQLEDIRFLMSNLTDVVPPEGPGIVVSNLPFDVRLKIDDILKLYGDVGTTLKHKFEGYDAYLFSTNLEAFKEIGLKTSKKTPLYSGGLEGSLRKYELYTGSKKNTKQKDTEVN